ncbi:hypothetical protein B0H10DRAFT_2054318 [Mycena sp. CBHHK59/15]|nr:hypothetical protein B0H10DRAFT_2054318 [Mycena sp. CBHHK59/15]
MPGRHVRFSRSNTFYSPPPLVHSSSSATSSSGPHTPPLPYVGLPGPTPFVPRRSYSDSYPAKARAHSLVAFTNAPLLKYDISLHPSTVSTHYSGVSSAGFLEPAVYPPRPTLSLISPHLPWTITVSASNGGYVTVSDVLNSVHRSLRVNVTPEEFNLLGTQKLMRRATAAYTQRYSRLKGHRGYTEEKSQGVKRVDFLMGCTKFQGISPAAGGADIWQLNVAAA